jgi:hypothetical protein
VNSGEASPDTLSAATQAARGILPLSPRPLTKPASNSSAHSIPSVSNTGGFTSFIPFTTPLHGKLHSFPTPTRPRPQVVKQTSSILLDVLPVALLAQQHYSWPLRIEGRPARPERQETALRSSQSDLLRHYSALQRSNRAREKQQYHPLHARSSLSNIVAQRRIRIPG